jgi:D-glycero-alpha-D-manno-heptose 1-phosphate guanylyltransferase
MIDIKIFILVGGFGTKLRKAVSNVPKPMAPINNKPFLSYQVDSIRKYLPKNQIYLLTYYMSDIIEEFFKDYSDIYIIKENNPLGTGGSIKNALSIADIRKDDRLMVLNGDTYIEPDYIDFINKASEPINMMTTMINDCSRFNTLEINNGIINKFNKKNNNFQKKYINAGCYLFNNLEFFNNIDEVKFSLEDKFSEKIHSLRISVYEYKKIFIDIGIPEDYIKLMKRKEDE